METPEKLKKIPVLDFVIEGYVSDSSPELYQKLITFLEAHGYNPDDLLYCGTDEGLVLNSDDSAKPSAQGIFTMNETGWQEAIKRHESTPASYADKEGGEQPCIAIYERAQLAEAYDYNVQFDDPDDYSTAVAPKDITPGKPLTEVPLDQVLNELVIHKDFPDALPSDALLAVVRLKQEDTYQTNDHGL